MTTKVALITGGATGIGKETASQLAARGVTVVISGRRAALGAEAVAEITAQARAAGATAEVSFFRNDVESEDEVRVMIDEIVRKHGRLDLAVNNAGISTENKSLNE